MQLQVLSRIREIQVRSFLFGLLFAACAICSFVNLIQNVHELLSFPYVISPVLVTPQRVQLPSVFVCLSGYINEQKLMRMYPQMYTKLQSRDLNSRTGRRLLAKWLDIGQLSELSYSLGEIFTQCTVVDGQMRVQNCLQTLQVKQWMSMEAKCFQFFRPELLIGNSSNYEYRLDELASLMWIVIRLNRSMLFSENVGLLLASGQPDSPQPFLTNPSFALLPTSVLYTVTMAYVKIVTRRLPYPYESNCLNYGEQSSQINCTFTCVAQLMNEENAHWPSIVLTDQLQLDNHLYFGGVGKLSQHLRWCERSMCRQLDCQSEQYLLFYKYAKYSYQFQSNFTIRIIYNYAPEQHVLYQPLFDLSELFSTVSFLFSPVSFWLGLAFLNIALCLINCIRRNRSVVRKAIARLVT